MTAWHRVGFASIVLLASACGDRDAGLDLAEVVDAAEPGATLQLEAGTYELTEQLVLDAPISIVGAEAGTTIEVEFEQGSHIGDRFAFQIRTDSAELVGLEITADDAEVTLVDVAEGFLDLSDVGLTGGRVGVRFSPSGAGEVNNSRFADSQFGLIVGGSSVAVESSEFTGHQDGIVFDGASAAFARGNTIGDCSNNGILVQADSQPRLVGNTLTGNGGGIAFYEGASGTASGNTLSDNRWGVDVRSPGPVVLTGNDFDGNEVAIQFWIQGGAGEVSGNKCIDNGHDILLAGPTKPDVGENACVTTSGPPHDPAG